MEDSKLHFSIRTENMSHAKIYINAGADVNEVVSTQLGETLLHMTASRGLDAFAGLLLDHGAVVDAQDKKGYTALHKAVGQGRQDMINLLIDRGASLDIQDIQGRTPLHYAASARQPEIAQLLLDAGANPLIMDSDGVKPSQAPIYSLQKSLKDNQFTSGYMRNNIDRFVQEANDMSSMLTSAEQRHELQQIAAQSRPAETEIAPPRRSSGLMM